MLLLELEFLAIAIPSSHLPRRYRLPQFVVGRWVRSLLSYLRLIELRVPFKSLQRLRDATIFEISKSNIYFFFEGHVVWMQIYSWPCGGLIGNIYAGKFFDFSCSRFLIRSPRVSRFCRFPSLASWTNCRWLFLLAGKRSGWGVIKLATDEWSKVRGLYRSAKWEKDQ